MYAISLTSIPPRFDKLEPVLRSLLAQRPAPERVILALPRNYARFPGPVTPPALPEGVEILRSDADLGPATKALPAARALAGRLDRLIWCDDDWIAGPGWARALLDGAGPNDAATGQGFSVARLKRLGGTTADGHADIAQGFSGVMVDPAWLAGPDTDPPDAAWPVDDIWLSGLLAHRGIAVRTRPKARGALRPAYADAHALQAARIGGFDRHAANAACLDALTERFGIWPNARN